MHVSVFAFVLEMAHCLADETNWRTPSALMAAQTEAAGVFERRHASTSQVTVFIAVVTEEGVAGEVPDSVGIALEISVGLDLGEFLGLYDYAVGFIF